MTRLVLICTLFSLVFCAPNRPLPALPSPDLASAQPAVRAAIESGLAAARANPNDPPAVLRLGMLLHAHNLLAAAATAYERAALLSPAAGSLYYWGAALAADGNYAAALAPLRESLQLADSKPVRLRLADTLYAAGQIPEARAEYQKLIAADPSLAAAHYGLGRCLQGAEAVLPLQRAIELFPRYGAARFTLASVYRQLGEKGKAEAALVNYERDKLLAPPIEDPAMAAVQALDASATGLLRASQSLERQGQLQQALELQLRALDADPKLTQAWVNLISLYARLGQPDPAEAAYKRAIAIEPKNAEAHYNFGVLCAAQERFDQAREAFAATIAIDPANAEALDSLGAVIERNGAWDRAAALYRQAIAAKPTLYLAHYHLGRILANQRRYAEAIAAFEHAVEGNDAQTPGFLYALGATHARAGSTAKAVEVLRLAGQRAARWEQTNLAAAIERDLATLRQRQQN